MQKILSFREKTIIFITIGAVVASIGFNFIVEPILKNNNDLNNKIKVETAKLKKYMQLLNQKEFISSKYNKFSETLLSSGINKESYVNILSVIENLAKESGIQIIDMRPENPKSANLYKESLIELRTEGDMESYFKFLYNIENSTILFTVKSFQLNTKPNSALLDGNFSISKLALD